VPVAACQRLGRAGPASFRGLQSGAGCCIRSGRWERLQPLGFPVARRRRSTANTTVRWCCMGSWPCLLALDPRRSAKLLIAACPRSAGWTCSGCCMGLPPGVGGWLGACDDLRPGGCFASPAPVWRCLQLPLDPAQRPCVFAALLTFRSPTLAHSRHPVCRGGALLDFTGQAEVQVVSCGCCYRTSKRSCSPLGLLRRHRQPRCQRWLLMAQLQSSWSPCLGCPACCWPWR